MTPTPESQRILDRIARRLLTEELAAKGDLAPQAREGARRVPERASRREARDSAEGRNR